MLKRFCLFSKKFNILSKPPPNLSSSLVTNLSPVWGPTRLDETSPVKRTKFFICRFLRVSKLKLTVLEREKLKFLFHNFNFISKNELNLGGSAPLLQIELTSKTKPLLCCKALLLRQKAYPTGTTGNHTTLEDSVR